MPQRALEEVPPKTELALNTALEASKTGVAIAKTLAAGLGACRDRIGGSYAWSLRSSQIKAFQLANKKTFRVQLPKKSKAVPTNQGMTPTLEVIIGLKGRICGIFNAKATRKYKPTLKAFVNAANKGALEQILIQDRRAIQGMNSTRT